MSVVEERVGERPRRAEIRMRYRWVLPRIARAVKRSLDIDLTEWEQVPFDRVVEELARIAEKEESGRYEVIRNRYVDREEMVIFEHIWVYPRDHHVPEDEYIVALDLENFRVHVFRNPEWRK